MNDALQSPIMLLIDGYNLLHVTGIFGRGRAGAGVFMRLRRRRVLLQLGTL